MTLLELSEYIQLHPVTLRKLVRTKQIKSTYRIMPVDTSDGKKKCRCLWFEKEWVDEYIRRFN